jgi:lysophospholipase L1-like esterase
MKISEIDRNLAVENSTGLKNLVWLDVKDAPFSIHGLWRAEKGKPFLRLPEDVAEATNDGVRGLNFHTAGGRIRFRTDSPVIALKAVMPDNGTMPHITMVGQSGFDLYRSDGGVYAYAGSFIPGNRNHGFDTYKVTDGKMHTYTVNMPLYDPVEEVYIGLDAGAAIDAAEPYALEKPVLYYGSSITQGGCASRPGNAYQAMISRRLDADFINLGFSGSARGERAICDYLASLDASVFVCDYDHNAPSADHLEATHRALYEIYRAKNPETPVIFVTKPDFHPESPEDVRRREIVLNTYHAALSAGDGHVSFVDGARLFEGPFADSCTVDGCHPNDLGFFRMAQKIGDAVECALKA